VESKTASDPGINLSIRQTEPILDFLGLGPIFENFFGGSIENAADRSAKVRVAEHASSVDRGAKRR
ncbi:MAG TPA: hypothetical protein VFR10_10635, partial [bacterium]|nr:hypothetical protein [bacterium]